MNNIERQLTALKGRLDKLYNTLETGKLEIDDIAPRIKDLKSQIQVLEYNKHEILDETSNPFSTHFDLSTIKGYVEDLSALLRNSSIIEQKTFLKSFIKRITVNQPEVKIDYTLPLVAEKRGSRNFEVLPIVRSGTNYRVFSPCNFLHIPKKFY
ncbi:MAG: hypothetical protein JXA66_02755 [Oligoflexia bacterium]|nr:hypothetical protein [Oligoflexia bacterium]